MFYAVIAGVVGRHCSVGPVGGSEDWEGPSSEVGGAYPATAE